jgi:hypothetical protein
MKGLILLISSTIIVSCSSEKIDEESTTPRQYTLTIAASEGGTLSPDANGKYNEGATLTITATPEEGYMFDRWEGSDNDNQRYGCWAAPGSCRTSITMDSDRDVQAFFEKISD